MSLLQMLIAFIIYIYEEIVMNGWISFIVGLFIGTIGGMVLMGILEMASLKDDNRYPRDKEDREI